MESKGKDTLQTISERTGYSISTVSRVLSGKADKYRISKAAASRIKAEAQQCDYTPNLLAKALRTHRSYTIGLTVPEVNNPFFASLASGVMNLLKERGYHTLLVDSMEDGGEELSALKMFLSRNTDGIIAVPVGDSAAVYEEFSKSVPIVLIDRYFQDTKLPYVCTDNYSGGKMATDYLIQRGYRRILSIQGVPSSMPNRERLRGFLDAISSHQDKRIESLFLGDAFSVENGYNIAMQVFGASSRPFDAVFAYSSTILLGMITAFRELGISVPDDVAVISFDNNGFLDFLDPAVTRVEQPLREIGEKATGALIDIIDCRLRSLPDPDPVHCLLEPSLVIRSSC